MSTTPRGLAAAANAPVRLELDDALHAKLEARVRSLNMIAPRGVGGWGIVLSTGAIWPSIHGSRGEAQDEIAGVFCEPWRRLYLRGFRAVRVRLEVAE